MNNRPLPLLFTIAAALGASALSAASQKPEPFGFEVIKAATDGRFVEIGARPATVTEVLGEPSAKLHPDIWLYYRQHAVDSTPANEQDCRTLIVTFKQGHVSDMKLVNGAALKVIAARLKLKHPVQYVAESK
jgi:hypothetical protein